MLVIAEVLHSQSYSASILRYCRFVSLDFYGGSTRSGATTRLQHPEWFPLCQAILKRGFEATSTVLVKPSSLQTELCLKLLQADKPSPCIVLTSSLQHYLLNALKDGLDDSVSSDFESGASDAISFWRRLQLANITEETPHRSIRVSTKQALRG